MPNSIAIVLAIAGAVLIVMGAIGGGFTLSAATMPAIGTAARVISFFVGATLIASSMYVFSEENKNAGSSAGAGPTVVAPAAAPGQVVIIDRYGAPEPEDRADENYETVRAPIIAPEGYDINLYWGLDFSAPVVARLSDGYAVEIVCTADGQSVTRSDGETSSLWNGVSIGNGVGGFVPDVYVYTGSNLPVMPNCAALDT